MINNLLNRKLAKFIGLIILIIGILTTTIIIKNPQILDIKASPDEDPISIQITNISDSQFSVSYTTNNKTIGTIMLGTDPNSLDILVLDDRDQLNQQIENYKSHHISPKDLEPETTYYFSINSGKKTFLNKNAPFSIKTGPVISSNPPIQQPLSGDVKLPSGNNANEGIVYLNTNGSQKISTLINNGKYILPLNSLLTENLSNYFLLNDNSILNLESTSDGLSSKTELKYNKSNPIRAITLNSNNPQGGIETPTPTPTIKDASSMDSTLPNTNQANISTQIPTNESKKNSNIEEINSIENQEKNTISSKNLSGIIFGLGVLLIIGSGIILFFFTRKKN